MFLGTDYSDFTDVGTLTAFIGSSGSKLSTTLFNGTPSGVDDGAVIAYGSLGSTIYPVRARNISNPSNGRGVGIELQPPGGSNSFRTGGRIISAQETTNKDYMDFVVNDAGSMRTMLRLSPNQNAVSPFNDNVLNLGLPSARWAVVYAATGAINTSDKRSKQDIASLDDAEKRVSVALKGLVKKFRFKDAVAEKGGAARIHVGVIAQEVVAAFQTEGLNANHYGILCYDKWDEQPEIVEQVLDEEGNATGETVVVQQYVAAGDRYGVRYDQLLAFILAAL